MKKEVLIHIRGLHTPDGESGEEPLELITTGEYYFRNNTHYLLYDEMLEGFTEPAHNMIKIRPGLMEVRKKGVVNVQMIFERDKKNLAIYKTPFGRLEMEISATRIMIGESANSFEIHAEYALGVNGSPITDCVMDIRAVPRDDKNFRIPRD